ncbi:AMP-binding protein [Alphaproteobacteria bacterium]|nr:AMP-binding protein [Alphaproteobacteria bacterium]
MFWESASNELDSQPFIIDGHDVYSFEEIFSLADALYKNIEIRSVVLIESERDLGAVLAYIGALRNGAIPLLIDANSARSTLDALIEDYKVDVVFAKNNYTSINYDFVICLHGFQIYHRFRESIEKPFDKLALLLPTSGSTGEAKCVRTSYENLNQATLSIMRYMEMDSSRVSISSLQLHYTYGLSVLNLTLASRSKFVLTKHSWIEREFWSLVELHGVTDLSGVPFMFQTLRRMKLSEQILMNLKCVNQAGGRLEPKLTEYFIDYFSSHDISYLTMYGATEASPRISYVPADRAKEKLGTVGLPIDIGKLYTEAEDGKSEGELIYEGPNVCLGYAYSRDDLTKGDENNHVLKTGDIGFIDEEGFATIVGRKKRFVKVFGMSVNLDALESIVTRITAESAVIGEDDNVKVLVTSDLPAKEIKGKIMSQVTFSQKGLKVLLIPEIYLNASRKPDYPKLTKEFL